MGEDLPASGGQVQPPPCLKVGAIICRGCPGWEAMLAAAGPDGPWRGALIHCACTGLTRRPAEEGHGQD